MAQPSPPTDGFVQEKKEIEQAEKNLGDLAASRAQLIREHQVVEREVRGLSRALADTSFHMTGLPTSVDDAEKYLAYLIRMRNQTEMLKKNLQESELDLSEHLAKLEESLTEFDDQIEARRWIVHGSDEVLRTVEAARDFKDVLESQEKAFEKEKADKSDRLAELERMLADNHEHIKVNLLFLDKCYDERAAWVKQMNFLELPNEAAQRFFNNGMKLSQLRNEWEPWK